MSLTLTLMAVDAGCALALLYPFSIYPVILRLLPERPIFSETAMAQDRRMPAVSLLFCAYNESAAMPYKIANLSELKALHPTLEILAFDDGSDDGTAALLDTRSDVLTLVRGAGRSGKAHGMKILAAHATGDILIFTDANVGLAPDAIDKLLVHYRDPSIGGVLGSLRYLGEGESATASIGSLYWRLEERLKDLESRCGNVMGADGSIFSIRRRLYPDFPDTVLDDLTVSMAVVFAGQRLVKASNVLAYERTVAAQSDEYRRKVRISARAWHTHHFLKPQLKTMAPLDRFKYGSRKLLRWFGGVFLIVGAVTTELLLWRAGTIFALTLTGAAFVAAYVGIRMRRGPLAAAMAIGLAYVATLQGVIKAMRGRTVVIWNPAKSR